MKNHTLLIEKLIIIFFQGLNPGRAIAEIKKLLAGFAEKGEPGLKGTAGLTQYSDKQNDDQYPQKQEIDMIHLNLFMCITEYFIYNKRTQKNWEHQTSDAVLISHRNLHGEFAYFRGSKSRKGNPASTNEMQCIQSGS